MNLSKDERKYITTLVLTAILGGAYIISEKKYDKEFYIELQEQIIQEVKEREYFNGVEIEGKSYLIYDLKEDKTLYEKESDTKMPLASLTKIMTAVVAIENINPEKIIEIEKVDLDQAGDNGLLLNEKWTRDELLKLMMVTSSNDAAHSFGRVYDEEYGEGSFVALMNRKAGEIGLTKTTFYNTSGIDVNSELNGGYGSAGDIIRLTAYAKARYPDILNQTAYTEARLSSLDRQDILIQNTNLRTKEITGINFSKTGYTNMAGGNLVVSFEVEPGHEVIVSVLGSTFTDRFDDVIKLSKIAVRSINNL